MSVEVELCHRCGQEAQVEVGATWVCLVCGWVGPLNVEVDDETAGETS